MSKKMKLIMEEWRSSALLERDLSITQRANQQGGPKRTSVDVDYDLDGILDQFDDIPFDARFDQLRDPSFLDLAAPGASDEPADIAALAKKFYKDQGINLNNPAIIDKDGDEELPGPQADVDVEIQQLKTKIKELGGQEVDLSKTKAQVEKVEMLFDRYQKLARGIEIIDKENFNDGKVTWKEFSTWFSARQSMENVVQRLRRVVLPELQKSHPWIYKLLGDKMQSILDTALRGQIGFLVGKADKKFLNIDAVVVKTVQAVILGKTGMYVPERVIKPFTNKIGDTVRQWMADKAEKVVDGATGKMVSQMKSWLGDTFINQSFEKFKGTDIEKFFSVDPGLENLLTIQDPKTKETLLKTFVDQYYKKISSLAAEYEKKVASIQSLPTQEYLKKLGEIHNTVIKLDSPFEDQALQMVAKTIRSQKELKIPPMTEGKKKRIIYKINKRL